MITAKRTNFLATDLLTTNSLSVTTKSDAPFQAATAPTTVSVSVNGVAAALPAYSAVTPVATGVPLYAAGAAWPQCRGSGVTNAMTGTSDLVGPGAGLSAVTLVSPALNFSFSSVAVDSTNNVYAVTTSGSNALLTKYSSATVPYTELWSFTATFIAFSGTHQYAFTPVLGANNSVYFMTSTGLYSVDATTGALNWLNTLRGCSVGARGNVLLDHDGNVYCSAQGQVFCVSPTGQTVWQAFIPRYLLSLSLDDNTGVLYGVMAGIDNNSESNSGGLFLLDARSGTPLQTVDQSALLSMTDDARLSIQCPIVGQNYVFVNVQRVLFAFTKQGLLAWSVRRFNPIGSIAYNPRLDRLYVTEVTDANTTVPQKVAIAALAGTTGVTLFTSTVVTANSLLAQPIIDANDNVYVFETGNQVRVFTADLTLLSTVVQALTLGRTPPLAFDVNGKLLIATSTGIYRSN